MADMKRLPPFLLKIIVIVSLIALYFHFLENPVNDVYASRDSITIHVTPTGTDSPECGSADEPCQNIQYAVNQSTSGDTILVAGGTYTYQSSLDTCSFLVTRAVVCLLNKHLTILGGYSPSNWSNPDPEANPTIIDGNNSRRGIAIEAYGTTASLHMEGFTIQNGLAQGLGSGGDFQTSATGGGIWAHGGSVNLRNVKLRNNRAIGGNTTTQYGGSGSGGGLSIQSPAGGVSSTLELVVFEGNKALGGTGSQRGGLGYGGGIFTYEAIINANDVTFLNNIAQAGNSSGKGVDSSGLRADALGGGAGFAERSNVTLTNVTATGNQTIGGNAGTASDANGGGSFGGAFYAEGNTVSLTDAIIKANTATGGTATNGGFSMGGGIMADSAHITMDRAQLIGNSSISGASHTANGNAGQPGGGGAYLTSFAGLSGITANIVNTIVADNKIEVGSPGRFTGGGGAGMTIQAINADIVYSTFAHNEFVGPYLTQLTFGQALMLIGLYGESGKPASADIDYTIFASHVNSDTDNTSALTIIRNSTANLNRGIFSNNTNNTNINNKPIPPGTIYGLSSMLQMGDLKFVSPGEPDCDYHLLPASPAIDMAPSSNIQVDVDGQPRPYNYIPDIGADEYNVATLTSQPGSILVMVDEDIITTRTTGIDVNFGPVVEWTATTIEDWVYLGSSGTSQQTIGQSGENLVVRVDSSQVNLGSYMANINITSTETNPTSIVVNLMKVDHVYDVYLPVTLR